MQDRGAAAQLALCLLGFALLLAALRAHPARAGARRTCAAGGSPAIEPQPLGGARGLGRERLLPAAGDRGVPAAGGAPGGRWRPARGRASPTRATAASSAHSLTLAGIAAAVTVAGAVLVGLPGADAAGPRGAGAGARRRARLRGAGRGDRGGAAGAVRRARQRHRRLGAGSTSASRPGCSSPARSGSWCSPTWSASWRWRSTPSTPGSPRSARASTRWRAPSGRRAAGGARDGAPADPEGQRADRAADRLRRHHEGAAGDADHAAVQLRHAGGAGAPAGGRRAAEPGGGAEPGDRRDRAPAGDPGLPRHRRAGPPPAGGGRLSGTGSRICRACSQQTEIAGENEYGTRMESVCDSIWTIWASPLSESRSR